MKKNYIYIVLGVLFLSYIITTGCVDNQGKDRKEFKINDSEAIDIVSQNETVKEYFIDHFNNEQWRLVRAILVNETFNELNESTYHKGYAVWKVQIMERSCACSGIKKLYVIEGYVSPFTGELTNITTGQVLESQYDKQICASIDCHSR
jgi:hypothetical protein